MRFNLYTFNKTKSPIYITQFDPQQLHNNLYSTFNEKVNHGDNDQMTLTFSIAGMVPNEQGILIPNPYLKYLIFGATVCLETSIGLYELIITQIAPQLGKECTIYNFTCQDLVSYKWSRINIGYSYNTMERGGVKTLFDIAREVLHDCKLDIGWQVKENNNHLYPNANLKNEKITLQVEGSNPYNVLVEGMNALNASMLVNYKNREIRFYQKNKVLFSGYRYRPETNLRSLSATYNIDELATILHVSGGTDEKDMNVMLVPVMPDAIKNYLAEHDNTLPNNSYLPLIENNFDMLKDYFLNNSTKSELEQEAYIKERQDVRDFCVIADRVPSLGQFLYNFDFFKQNGLMTAQQYDNITEIFNVKMRDINFRLKPLVLQYYNISWDLNKVLVDAETVAEFVNGAYNSILKEYQTTGLIDEANKQTAIEEANRQINELSKKFDNVFVNNWTKLYGYKIRLTNGELVPELQDLQTKVGNYIKMRDESQYYYHLYQKQYKDAYDEFYNVKVISPEDLNPDGTYNHDRAELEGNILYYYNRFYSCLQLCGNSESFKDFENQDKTSIYYCDAEYLPMQENAISITSVTGHIGAESSYYLMYTYMTKPFKNLSIVLTCNISEPDIISFFSGTWDKNTVVDWGDNTIDNKNSHLYRQKGTYLCKIYNINRIPTQMFSGLRDKITQIFICDNIESIGSGIIFNCYPQRIYLSNNVTKIASPAFLQGTLNTSNRQTPTIYCEAPEAKPGWNEGWNKAYQSSIYCPVYYSAFYDIYSQMNKLQEQNQDLWNNLYTNYSSFIYEATYENSDELNSVSLFNQATAYFENYHHPKSSYSVEILNLDDLEQIGVPNLKVNSRIRIYNDTLGLNEGSSYDGTEGTELNNISYTTNELLITGLSYELRKSAAVSITVEQIVQHQILLQKLIKSIR